MAETGIQQRPAWPLSSWTDAAQLAALIDRDKIPAEAAGIAPAQWFATLRGQGKRFDAVLFIAHALPRYECVVWAARVLSEGGVLDRGDPFLTAALRWIDAPGDGLRRAAGALSDESRRSRSGETLCKAVFYSGGSIAPDELPPVQPPPHMCGRMAAGAVITGAYERGDPVAVLERACDIGDEIASQR